MGEERQYPDSFRECSITGGSCSVILRTTFEEEDMEYLTNKAVTLINMYEDESLRDNIKAELKEAIKNIKKSKE